MSPRDFKNCGSYLARRIRVLDEAVLRRLTRLNRRLRSGPVDESTVNEETPQDVGGPTRLPSSAPARGRSPIPAGSLEPNECALLLLGCQPGVLAAVPDHSAFVTKINTAIDVIRLHDGHVIHARMAFDPSDNRFPPMTNKQFSALVRARQLQNGTPDAELHPALAVRPHDIQVRTTRLGGFSTTNLDEQLTNHGVTTLIVAGAHTSGALLTTVREAADRDYRLIVLVDCAADPDPEVHSLLFQRIFPRQADILRVPQLYTAMARTTQPSRYIPPDPLVSDKPQPANW
ncbi:cysteine hydrolase [Mycobacterium sp. 050128]|uniref:cysteine hydrolase n=1 Tax=Mycobacterium sp. 050128 TaxID=3096112 RepID=UPI002ED8E639